MIWKTLTIAIDPSRFFDMLWHFSPCLSSFVLDHSTWLRSKSSSWSTSSSSLSWKELNLCLVNFPNKGCTGCPKKNALLSLKSYNSGLEAAIWTSRDSFGIFRLWAFIWDQEVQDYVKASLRKLHLKLATLSQKTVKINREENNKQSFYKIDFNLNYIILQCNHDGILEPYHSLYYRPDPRMKVLDLLIITLNS